MKICFVAHNLDIKNGDGRFAWSLIKSIQSLGNEVVVFVEQGQEELLGARAVLHSRGLIKKFILNPWIIGCEAKRAGVDIIHAFDAWPRGVWAYFAGLVSGVPFGMTIYATYGILPLTKPIQGFLLRLAYRKSSLNAAISWLTADRIKEMAPKTEVEIINQGIDFEKYQGPAEPSIVSGRYMLTVAYMKFRKGYHIAIPAFAKLKEFFPDLKYVIRAADSDPKYFEDIKKTAAESGVEKDIVWLPKLEEKDLINIYKNAEVFFFPTLYSNPLYFEGFAATPLEAEACGIPVVKTRMSNKGGVEEAADNKTGFLFKEGDIAGAVDALKKILGDGNLREKFSKNAREFARSFDWKIKAEEYLKRYSLIIQDK